MTYYLLAFAVSAVTIFLKGFQHKNVIGNHYRLVAVTSVLMAVGDVAVVGLIVKQGWWMALPLGAGAALGMVTSMWVHQKFVK